MATHNKIYLQFKYNFLTRENFLLKQPTKSLSDGKVRSRVSIKKSAQKQRSSNLRDLLWQLNIQGNGMAKERAARLQDPVPMLCSQGEGE